MLEFWLTLHVHGAHFGICTAITSKAYLIFTPVSVCPQENSLINHLLVNTILDPTLYIYIYLFISTFQALVDDMHTHTHIYI